MSRRPRSPGRQPGTSSYSLATQRAQGRTKLHATISDADRCRHSSPGCPDPSTQDNTSGQDELDNATAISDGYMTRVGAGDVVHDLAAGGSRTSSIGMQERNSDENTMDDFYVSDDEFHVPFLPVLSPRCVTISRRFILDLALKRLGLTIEDTKVTDAGDGELYASISIHLSADKGRRPLEPKVFHGDFAGTKEKSIESASSAALAFLKDKSMIYVDDANYHELKACQHNLLAASSWAMLFEDRAAVLKKQMSKLSGEARNIEKEIDVSSDSRDTNDTCPLALVDMKDTSSQQSTPPPKIDSPSKRTGKQVVCATRRVLFGKRKCNQEA